MGQGLPSGGAATTKCHPPHFVGGRHEHPTKTGVTDHTILAETALDRRKQLMAIPNDDRTAAKVLRQWEKLQTVRNQLVKQGLLNGDATATQVLDKLREQIPADLFT